MAHAKRTFVFLPDLLDQALVLPLEIFEGLFALLIPLHATLAYCNASYCIEAQRHKRKTNKERLHDDL